MEGRFVPSRYSINGLNKYILDESNKPVFSSLVHILRKQLVHAGCLFSFLLSILYVFSGSQCELVVVFRDWQGEKELCACGCTHMHALIV